MEKITYQRPTQEEWDHMSEGEHQGIILLEAVEDLRKAAIGIAEATDDIRRNTKSTRDIAVIFLVLVLLGMVGVFVS